MSTSEYVLRSKDDKPLQVLRYYPALAAEIGHDKSIVLAQLLYWVTEWGHERDGRKWVRITYKTMRNKGLGCYSDSTLSRLINKLVKLGLVDVTTTYNSNPYDHGKWYAINSKGMQKLTSISYGPQENVIEPEPDRTPDAQTPNLPSEISLMNQDSDLRKEERPTPPPVTLFKSSPSESPKKMAQLRSKKETQTSNPLLHEPAFVALAREIADLTCMDFQLNLKKIITTAEAFWNHNYTIQNLKTLGEYWVKEDYRGKQGGLPNLAILPEIIKRAMLWHQNGAYASLTLCNTGYLSADWDIPDYLER